jgi:gp16 family phage-associated protein
MSTPNKTKTPDQVKEDLRKDGKTVAQWAEENGYTRRQVYAVLGGQIKGHFGRSHEIAKKLGLKFTGNTPNQAA